MRLDVAVDDPARMCVLKRLCDLRREMERLAPVQLTLLLHILLERDPVDQLHYDIIEAVGVRHIVDAHDIRVRQHRDRL